MYKGSIFRKHVLIVLFMPFLFCVIEMQAQSKKCIIGKTGFETNTVLCNPNFTNDTVVGGWFYEDLGTELDKECSSGYSVDVNDVITEGVKSAS